MINKKEMKPTNKKLMLIGIFLISIISLIFLVSALTSDERQSLNDELNNLIADLNSQGYSWLTDYSINYPFVEVYRAGDNQSIASFGSIINEGWYKIYLTNLSEDESYDVFDLRVLGNNQTGVEFDYIVDPVYVVNQTGGDAYIGWHTGNDLNDPENFGPPADVYTQYTTAQKEIVSNYTDDYVESSGSGVGGVDCSYPTKTGSVFACLGTTIDLCNEVFQFSAGGASSCLWVSGPNICVANQPCARYPFHKFVFNVTKSMATNINFLFGMKQNGIDPSTVNTNVFLYLRNYSSTSVESYVYLKNIGSVTCYNVTFCNLTYSTTNINNYINASGQITAYIMNANTWNLHVYYAEVNVSYDTIYPTWSNNKTNLTSATPVGEGVYFNITLTEANPSAYIFSWYNGTTWENTTGSYTDAQEISITKTINSDTGTINWTWYINDTANNLNQTSVWSIVLSADDATPPNITIVYPLNATIYSINVSEINYTSSGASSCWYSIDNGVTNSSSVSAGTNFTGLSGVNDANTWKVYCNDSAGNLNSSSVTFYSTYISNCTSLTRANTVYTLMNNVTTTGSCFTVSVSISNITLDMNGYSITGDRGATDTGITGTAGGSGLTVKNGGIYNFGYGIYQQKAVSFFNNLTFGNNKVGIWIRSSNINIFNNNFNSNNVSIYLTNSDSNNLTNNNNFNSTWGIELEGSKNNQLFGNNFSSNSLDVYVLTLTLVSDIYSTNNTFTNCTYNTETVNSGNELTRKWYYTAYVNDTAGANVSGANITAYNSTGSYQFNLTTGADGLTSSSAQIIDYINTAGTRTYYSPYNVYALNSTYVSLNQSWNVTAQQNNRQNFELVQTNLTACGTLNRANTVYTLMNNVNTSGSCFNITADNVTLDGNGKTVTGDSGASDYGITTPADSNLVNITIKNFGNINSFTRGISLDQVNNSLIYNNALNPQVQSSAYVIYLEDGDSNKVENNNITWNPNIGYTLYGIYLNVNSGKTAGNNNITGNNLIISSQFSNIYGISLNNAGTSNSNIIQSNIIGVITNTAPSFDYGVYLYNTGTSNSNIIQSNAINISSSDSSVYGVYLYNTGTSMNSNTIYNQTINVYSSESNPTLFKSYGVYLNNADYSNVSLLRINASAPSAYASDVYLLSGSDNNVFRDMALLGTDTSIYIASSGGTNNTFVNVSYSGAEIMWTNSQLIRKWYYTAHVNDTLGNNVSNANVTAYNSTGSYQFNLTTDATGKTGTTEIIDYIITVGSRDTVINYYSPYNIYASNSSYPTINNSWNVTAQQNNRQTITLDNVYPLISYASDTLADLSRVWQTNVYVNVSVTEANFKNITFKLYYSNNTAVNTTTYTTAVYNINWTGLSGDDYKYNSTVCDIAGNCNSTSTRSITLITSQSNISLNKGWNLIALPMAQTDNGTDRNISLVSGWNLIGYTSDTNLSLADTTFNNGTNSYTWAQALSNGKQQAYLAYYDSSPSTVSQRKYKYLSAENGLDDSAFRQGKGYWVYSNQSGILTLPNVNGTASGATYQWDKLRFRNSAGVEKNITDARNLLWLDTIFQYSDTSYGSFKYISDDPDHDLNYIPYGKGIFIYSYYDNITLVREN